MTDQDMAERAREQEKRVAADNLRLCLIPLNPDPIDPDAFAERFISWMGELFEEFDKDVLHKAAAVLTAIAEARTTWVAPSKWNRAFYLEPTPEELAAAKQVLEDAAVQLPNRPSEEADR